MCGTHFRVGTSQTYDQDCEKLRIMPLSDIVITYGECNDLYDLMQVYLPPTEMGLIWKEYVKVGTPFQHCVNESFW